MRKDTSFLLCCPLRQRGFNPSQLQFEIEQNMMKLLQRQDDSAGEGKEAQPTSRVEAEVPSLWKANANRLTAVWRYERQIALHHWSAPEINLNITRTRLNSHHERHPCRIL